MQLVVILLLMTVVFRVPIHGSVFLLLGALGRLPVLAPVAGPPDLVAGEDADRGDADRAGILLPSIMLSGYIFPLSSLPAPCARSRRSCPPPTSSRSRAAIIIRGAGFADLTRHVGALLVIAAILVAGSTRAFRKTIS